MVKTQKPISIAYKYLPWPRQIDPNIEFMVKTQKPISIAYKYLPWPHNRVPSSFSSTSVNTVLPSPERAVGGDTPWL
jgi:hypothetical protein